MNTFNSLVDLLPTRVPHREGGGRRGTIYSVLCSAYLLGVLPTDTSVVLMSALE